MTRSSYPTKSKDELPARRKYDNYPTELSLVVAAIGEVIDVNKVTSPIRVLDPGAGTGVWGRVSKMLMPSSLVYGVEVQELPKPSEFDHWFVQSYLDFFPDCTFDLICGNPPFGGMQKPPLWELFLRKSWKLLSPGGSIAFLLKVEISTGLGRKRGLWQELPPTICLPCCPRPSHTGDRKTNKNDLALWVWRKSHEGNVIGTLGQWPTRPFDWVTKCREVLE